MSLVLTTSLAQAAATSTSLSSGQGQLSAKLIDTPTDPLPEVRTSWGVRLYGRGVSDSTEQSIATGVLGTGTLKYDPAPWINTTISPGIVVETGSLSSLYDTNIPRNQVYLDEALVDVKPVEFFTFSAGAINQRFIASPLLIDAQSFPGATQNFHLSNDVTKFSLIAQEAIPTSVSFSTLTSEKEALPQFFTQTAMLELKAQKDLKLTLRATHFQFMNLPSQVAYKSSINGNSDLCVSGDVPQSMRFLCQFGGWTGGGQVDLRPARNISLAVGGDYLVNTGAPAGENQGYMTFGQVKFAVSPKWRFTTRGEFFVNESDTSPAFYNSVAYGHSNRQGYAGELKFENTRSGFDIRARYVDARLIEENPNQANTTIFFLSLGFFSGKP